MYVAQLAQLVPSMHKTLGSNLSTPPYGPNIQTQESMRVIPIQSTTIT